MKLPRPRFTMRWLMVAVAIAGVVMGLAHRILRRAEHFRAQRDLHMRHWTLTILEERDSKGRIQGPLRVSDDQGKPVDGPRARRELWDYKLYKKYEHAARYPWLPVAPDPPEPE